MKTKTKAKMKTKTTLKNKNKNEIENKNKKKNENEEEERKHLFHFVFCFRFCFCFWFLNVFAFLFNSPWPIGAMDGQLSLDWPRSAIAPRNMAPCLIRICRIQWCCSLFPFSTGNALFGQIWSKMSKLSV